METNFSKRRIAVFVSGNGSNFEAIAQAAQQGVIPSCEVALCVCDRPGAGALLRAERLGIDTLVFSARDYASKAEYEAMIADALDAAGIQLVCLAGYMRIVGDTLLERYEGRIINIHPSLLPSFPGAHGIQDAFEHGCKMFGVTIHYVDKTLDGGRIIDQQGFHYDGDDINELEEMIHATEHRLYPATITRLLDTKL